MQFCSGHHPKKREEAQELVDCEMCTRFSYHERINFAGESHFEFINIIQVNRKC